MEKSPISEADYLAISKATGLFDSEFYLSQYPDVAAAGADPLMHYMLYGFREGRNPSAAFNTIFYTQRYLKGNKDINPLLHYLQHRHEDDIRTQPPEDDTSVYALVKRFTSPSLLLEEHQPLAPTTERRAKLLTYYLTQFHPIPENDHWWGAGFTEWTNIPRGLPRFRDHYQPRVPRDLGFYSLDNVETLRKQVAMAKSAGIYGYIIYYYSFNGKRLLQRPLDLLLETRSIDMPFCLMWANENWTRRWDGRTGEVLIAESYDAGYENALLEQFNRHFSDPRYIRINGRPLLMLYHASLIPSTRKTVGRWRESFEKHYGERPLIVMSQAFDDVDPAAFDLDGAIEFPPHKLIRGVELQNPYFDMLDTAFTGMIYRYDDVVDRSLNERAPAFPIIKTAIPSWDNDSRRQGTGLVVHGSSPKSYERWLATLVQRARARPFFGEPFVCVNAWNEWCEGAYLEPDLHFGAAYLNATARAAVGTTSKIFRHSLLLVGHDAFPGGSQHLLLNIGRTLQSAHGLDIEFLLLAGGQLLDEYAATAPTTLVENGPDDERIQNLLRRSFSGAIANTCATGAMPALLARSGIDTVFMVHEMPQILNEKALLPSARDGIASAKQVIFPSTFVFNRMLQALDIPPSNRFIIRTQGCYKQIVSTEREIQSLKHNLRLGTDSKLVLGVGYGDLRKGFDRFLQLWGLFSVRQSKIHFCWVGDIDPDLRTQLASEIANAQSTGTFHLPGYRDDVDTFYSASDAFVLPSREDPFPTVALEAMSAGLPVITFEDSGGVAEFLRGENLGVLVPNGDVPELAKKLRSLLASGISVEDRTKAKRMVEDRFSFHSYVRDLFHICLPSLPSISVIVISCSDRETISNCLRAVFAQMHPIEDLIVLTHPPADSIVEATETFAEENQRDLSLVIEEDDQQSLVGLWRRAAELAKSDFLWIIDSATLADGTFLSRTASAMSIDPDIRLAYCPSLPMEANLVQSKLETVTATGVEAFREPEVLSPNAFFTRILDDDQRTLDVSTLLWRPKELADAISACESDLVRFRTNSDWRILVEYLSPKTTKISYLNDCVSSRGVHSSNKSEPMLKRAREFDAVLKLARKRFKMRSPAERKQKSHRTS